MKQLDPGPFILFALATLVEAPTATTVAALAPPPELAAPLRVRLERLVYYAQQLVSDADVFALDAIMHELANITLAPNYHGAVMNALSRAVMANLARREAERQFLQPAERIAAGI